MCMSRTQICPSRTRTDVMIMRRELLEGWLAQNRHPVTNSYIWFSRTQMCLSRTHVLMQDRLAALDDRERTMDEVIEVICMSLTNSNMRLSHVSVTNSYVQARLLSSPRRPWADHGPNDKSYMYVSHELMYASFTYICHELICAGKTAWQPSTTASEGWTKL